METKKTILLMRYSQISGSDISKSLAAFAQETGLDINKIGQIAHAQGGSPLTAYKPEELEKIKGGAIYSPIQVRSASF